MKQPYGSTLPVGPTAGDVAFLTDGTIHFCYLDGVWTAVGGGSGSAQLQQQYDQLILTKAGDTSTLQSNFLSITQRKSPHIRSYTFYSQCRWDIFEFDSGASLVNSWSGMQFSSIGDAYTFLAANAVTGGGVYTNNIVARIYDVIDSASPRITKIYGMNTFYSNLRGRRNYKTGYVVACENTATNWAGLPAWFEDLCNQGMGLPAGYTWNAADNAERVLWFARNDGGRKRYGLPKTGFSSNIGGNNGRREWDWGTSSWINTPVPNTYVNSGGKLAIWCALSKTAYDTSWDFFDSPSALMRQFGPNYSVLRLYRLERQGSGYNALLVKPMGVDRLGLSWFDVSSYDLVAAYTKKDKTIQIRTINLGGAGTTYEERWNDLIWVEISACWPQQWQGTVLLNYSATYQLPRIRFFLRDKTTGLISPLSDMRVQFSMGMQGAPIKIEVQ